MLNKAALGAMILACTLGFTGCAPKDTETESSASQNQAAAVDPASLSPEQVLSAVLQSQIKDNNPGAGYVYLSSSDKAVKTLEAYTRDNDIGPWRQYQDKYGFEIKSVEVDNDKAKAKVALTIPDMEKIMTEALTEEKMAVLNSAFQAEAENPDSQKVDQLILEVVSAHYEDGKTLPLTTEEEEFELIKEADGWKIHHGWEKETDTPEGAPPPANPGN